MNKFAFLKAGGGQNLLKVMQYINHLAPLLLVLAGLSVWFAAVQVQKAVTVGGQTVVAAKAGRVTPTLADVPLEASGYMDAGQMIARLNSGVVTRYDKDRGALIISVSDPALFPEWFYALATLQSYRKNLIWQAARMCVKKCEGGDAAKAELKAYTQQIKMN